MHNFLFSTFLLTSLISDYYDLTVVAQHRVAPGVPPQQYQPHLDQNFHQPPPPGHHQGQQQHFQQHQQQGFQGQPPPPQQQFVNQLPPTQHQQQQQFQQQQPPQHVQQQQPPQHVQQQQPPQHVQHQQPPPPQGVAPGQGHAHPGHGHHGGQPILDASNLSKERQHIQEHMEVPIDTSQMSEQELQFHYFKMHDADNNNKLDGCELVKSLIHWHDSANHDPKAGVPIPEPKIFNDEELINMIDPILQNDDKNGDGFIDYGEFSLAQASAATRAKTP